MKSTKNKPWVVDHPDVLSISGIYRTCLTPKLINRARLADRAQM